MLTFAHHRVGQRALGGEEFVDPLLHRADADQSAHLDVPALADPKLGVLSPIALFPHVKARVKATKENGGYVPIVHDGKGGPVVQDGAGNPMTIPGLIEDLRKSTSFAPLFASRSSSGSGTPPNGSAAGGGGGPKKIKASDHAAMSANIKEIAAGTVVVEDA